MANEDRLQALLEQLTEMEQMESREELDGLSQLAKEILSLDPLNPRAKLALWASLEEEEAAKSLHLLEEALDAVRPLVNEGTPGMPEDDINAETYGASLECLSVFNYNLENYEKALAFAKELVAFDDEGLYEGRIPLYCALLKLEKHTDILSALDADPLETLVGEYARAFAHHGMGGKRMRWNRCFRPFQWLRIFPFSSLESGVSPKRMRILTKRWRIYSIRQWLFPSPVSPALPMLRSCVSPSICWGI